MPWKRPVRAAARGGERLLDRALCVAGAVAFSQAPEYMQQYLQRLGGHLAEAQRHLHEFENVAVQTGQTFERLVATSKASADAAYAKLGGVMEATSARVAELTTAETALREASPLTRPFVFLRHVDSAIAHDTWTVFQPAVPTTLEGALYALAGMVVLLALYHGAIKYPTTCPINRRRARRRQPVPKAVPVAAGKG